MNFDLGAFPGVETCALGRDERSGGDFFGGGTVTYALRVGDFAGWGTCLELCGETDNDDNFLTVGSGLGICIRLEVVELGGILPGSDVP